MTEEEGNVTLTYKEHNEAVQKAVHDALRSARKRVIYPLAAVFVSMFVVGGLNMIYTNSAVRNNEQTWCELVSNLDNQNQKTPPPSENGKVFARQMHSIRVKFECK